MISDSTLKTDGPEPLTHPSQPNADRRNTFSLLLIVLSLCIFVGLAYTLFGAGGRDDAFITDWPAYTFATQGKIVNYNGDSIEQSSSLLQVLALGTVSKLTNQRPDQVGWAFMLVCAVAAVALTLVLAKRILPDSLTGVSMALVLSPPLLYWGVSELEGPLAALCLLLVVVGWAFFLRSKQWWALLSSIPYVLVRPESAIVLSLAAFLIGVPKANRRNAVFLLASAIIFGGALALFRKSWTGYAAPLPVYVKGGFQFVNFLVGAEYLALYLPVLAIAVYGLVRLAKISAHGQVILAIFLASIAFIFAVGGDWMEGWRFLVPITPFIAIGIGATKPVARYAAIIGQVLLLGYFANSQSTGTPIWARGPNDPRYPWQEIVCRDHRRDLTLSEQLNAEIRALLQTQPSVEVMSIRMGLPIYRAKLEFGDRVKVVDLMGLCEDSIYKNGLSWKTLHPNQPEPWKTSAIQRETSFNQDDIIMVKHALFNRRALLDDAVKGLPRKPDIIFNVAPVGGLDSYMASVRRLNYKIIGVLSTDLSGQGPLPGQPIRSTVVIAIKQP